MFLLVTDEDGREVSRLQVRKFSKRTGLLLAVQYSLTGFLNIEWKERISLVLDNNELDLLEKIILELYGNGYSQARFRELLGFVVGDTLKPLLFGDTKNFRIAAEDVFWINKRGETTVSTGISIYRVKKTKGHSND